MIHRALTTSCCISSIVRLLVISIVLFSSLTQANTTQQEQQPMQFLQHDDIHKPLNSTKITTTNTSLTDSKQLTLTLPAATTSGGYNNTTVETPDIVTQISTKPINVTTPTPTVTSSTTNTAINITYNATSVANDSDPITIAPSFINSHPYAYPNEEDLIQIPTTVHPQTPEAPHPAPPSISTTNQWTSPDSTASTKITKQTSSINTSNSATFSVATSTINTTFQTINQNSPPYTTNNHNITTSNVHPLLIYSIRYEIKSYDLFAHATSSALSTSLDQQLHHQPTLVNKHLKTLIAGLKNTIALDFYYSQLESYIFWTDVIEERIYKGTITNGTITNVEMVVQTGLGTAEGLAVDWIGQNIYWVESTLDHIEVANMNGTWRKTLIAGDMENPRAIAVDPRYGLLFWTDWDKKNPRVERATMSGKDRRILVSIEGTNSGWPNGLTLDYEALKIYWVDANSDSLHVSDYEGNNHQTLLNNIKSLGHPFSITLFGQNLYWTDWKTNSISTANKHNGSEVKDIQRLTQRLFDIKVFHPSRQPKIDENLNPCHINNGNCSHLCLLSLNHTRICDCPRLMNLASDGLTCESDERVLLIGKTNEIRGVAMREPLYHIMAPISVPKVFNPKQFEYDAKSKTIFWADSQTNEVKRAQLAGNNIDTVIDVIIDAPSGLALDWVSGNIYVTSAPHMKTSGKIYISNLNGEYISILMDESQGLISPRSLAVHPMLGLLFCIDENEKSQAIIFSASMDGRNKRTIASRLNNPQLENPSNLAIDYEMNRVYWINRASNTKEKASIQYYDIPQDKIVTILDENEVELSDRMNPNVLCVDGDYLLISTRMPNENIIRLAKNNLTERTLLKTQKLEQLSALRVYNASSQTGTNACSVANGNCSQLCVPTNSTNRVCKCTMGYSSNPENETECIGKDLFLIISYNLGMKGISLEPNSSLDDYYLPPIHKALRASSIDYVSREHLLYWVDSEEGSITRINRDTTNYKVVIQGLESDESIAIDWVAGNIYWLDPYFDIIEIARLDGSNRYVIVSGDMDKANGIVVNPLKGYLVWSDAGSYPRIETALLDGSNRRVVVNLNLSHIEDLTIDYVEDYIYWVDSTLGLIERIRRDGSGRHVVVNLNTNQGSHYQYTSIAIYKEHLYIADPLHNQGSIIRCDKNNAADRIIIQQQLGDGIRDIAIFADQPLPLPEENPCVRDNGGCQDLCLYLGQKGKRRCICSHGKLNLDGSTCRPFDTFLLFSKLSQIDSLHITEEESINNSPYPPISIENRSNIISLTVDYDSRRVIYSDLPRDQICSVFFNGTDRKVLVEKQYSVEGIAFVNDQLYWTSIYDNSISRLNTTSSGSLKCQDQFCTNHTTVEKIIRLNSDDRPRGIAVDICTSYVYWTNWNNNASIQRASPYTGYKIESIIKTSVRVPNGIAIDQKTRKLYWCDAKLDKIEVCDMDGSNRVVLISAAPQHPFALAIWENYVFWTDWVARGVFRADKHTGLQPVQIKKLVQRPMGIAVAATQNFVCPFIHCGINNGGCPTGYQCIMRQFNVDCQLHPELNHAISLPPHRCYGRYENGSCEHTSYRDIIMDNFERYNYSEQNETLDPIPIRDASKRNKTSPLQAIDMTSSAMDQNVTATSSDLYAKTSPVAPIERSLVNEATRRANIPLTQTARTPETQFLEKITVKSSPPVSSSTSLPYSSETSDMSPVTTAVSVSRTTAAPPSSGTPSNNTTLAPCQIVPAALQPTTDASSVECKGQFRCYLSDKLMCISAERRCDGNYDCPSKEDENDCSLAKRSQYSFKRETNWHKFVMVFLIIVTAAIAAVFLVFGNRGRRRWFLNTNGAFNHRRMFDDNGTNIEISNPMFDEDDPGHLVHCAFSIDLNERTTNFSNPLYERQVLLMNDKHVTQN